MKRKLIYEDMLKWTILKLSTAVMEEKDTSCLHPFCLLCTFLYPLQFLLPLYSAIIFFYTAFFFCCLALSIFDSLPCSPSCGAYANAGINHYASVTVNHYANVTVPTCQTGGQAAYKDLSFPLLFCSLYPLMY